MDVVNQEFGSFIHGPGSHRQISGSLYCQQEYYQQHALWVKIWKIISNAQWVEVCQIISIAYRIIYCQKFSNIPWAKEDRIISNTQQWVKSVKLSAKHCWSTFGKLLAKTNTSSFSKLIEYFGKADSNGGRRGGYFSRYQQYFFFVFAKVYWIEHPLYNPLCHTVGYQRFYLKNFITSKRLDCFLEIFVCDIFYDFEPIESFTKVCWKNFMFH